MKYLTVKDITTMKMMFIITRINWPIFPPQSILITEKEQNKKLTKKSFLLLKEKSIYTNVLAFIFLIKNI